jgi:exonuclease SbcC
MDLLVKNESKGMLVELDFVSNGKEYTVRRVRGKTRSEPRLGIKEGDKFVYLATKDRQVTEEVQNILEMDSDLFLNAVYVKQGEISDLIEKTPSEKKKMIGKLLGIENLENAWKNMQSLISSYETQKDYLKGKIEGSDHLEESYRKKKEKWKYTTQKIGENAEKIKKAESESQNIKTDLEYFNDKKGKFDVINSDIKKQKIILDNLSTNKMGFASDIEQIKRKESEIDDIKPKIERLGPLNKLKEYLGTYKHLKSEKAGINESISQIIGAKSVLDEKKEEYQNYIDIKFEIQVLEKERKEYEGSLALHNQFLDQKKQLDQVIESSNEIIIQTLENYNKILNINAETVEDFERQFNQIKPVLEEQKDEITTSLDELNKKIARLNYQNESLKKPINELEKVQDKCPICLSPIDEVKREELINRYSDDINSNKQNILNFQSQLRDLSGNKNSIDSKFLKVQDINLQLLKEKLQNLDKVHQNSDLLEEKIQQLGEDVKKLKQYDEKLSNNRSTMEELDGSYQKYLKANGILESMDSLEDYNTKLKLIDENIDVLKNKIRIIQEKTGINLDDLDAQIGDLDQTKTRYNILIGEISKKEEILKKIGDCIEEIENNEKIMNSMIRECEELDYNPEKHQIIARKYEAIINSITQFKTDNGVLIGRESELSRALLEMEKQLEEYTSNKQKLGNITDYIKLLGFIRDLYGKDGIQRDLRKRSKPLIEQRTREFFERFNFDYSDIKIDEDYDITVYGPSGGNNLDMISGGERIAVALALRLGITRALAGGNLELIMLDEPTIHLDSTRRQELIDLLKRMSIIPQMIIVTHDFDLEEAADNVLRIKKEDGNSFLVEN